MNTTTRTMTKSDLIARLVLIPGHGSARHLRDKRRAELLAMLEAVETKARQQAAPATIDPKSLYTVAEVADLLGVTKAAVRRWVRVGHLTATTSPQITRKGQFVIDGKQLAGYLARRSVSS